MKETHNNQQANKHNNLLISVKTPFPIHQHSTNQPLQTLPPSLALQDIKKILKNQQNINLKHNQKLILSAKKIYRPLYEVKIVRYQHRVTGDIVERIEDSRQVERVYQCGKLCDFYVGGAGTHTTLDQMKTLLTNKILHNHSIDQYKFTAKPPSYLKPFNLAPPTTDLLVNKSVDRKKQFKSQQISYTDPIPVGPPIEDIPAYVTSLKIYGVVREYLEKRPCWLRNVLEYQLRIDGFRGMYTVYQLKNVLRYFCYTFRDGPWKHVFCRFGFNPLQNRQAALYQTFIVKIKKKQVQDYQQNPSAQLSPPPLPLEQQQRDIYDPTFSQMPTKFMRIYQLCDIEDRRIEELVKSTAALSQECSRDTGWFTKNQFGEIQKIFRSIREDRARG